LSSLLGFVSRKASISSFHSRYALSFDLPPFWAVLPVYLDGDYQPAKQIILGMHTVELSGSKLAQKIHALRARRARAGLTVYPPWIKIIDVFDTSSQSCDRKSKFGLRHGIKLG
jgi:hypothetical protein